VPQSTFGTSGQGFQSTFPVARLGRKGGRELLLLDLSAAARPHRADDAEDRPEKHPERKGDLSAFEDEQKIDGVREETGAEQRLDHAGADTLPEADPGQDEHGQSTEDEQGDIGENDTDGQHLVLPDEGSKGAHLIEIVTFPMAPFRSPAPAPAASI